MQLDCCYHLFQISKYPNIQTYHIYKSTAASPQHCVQRLSCCDWRRKGASVVNLRADTVVKASFDSKV